MKQILTSKILRKLLILSCLVAGFVFVATNENIQSARAAARTECSEAVYQQCEAQGKVVAVYDCSCVCFDITEDDCRLNGDHLNTNTCQCESGPGASCGQQAQEFCMLSGGTWNASLCYCSLAR